MQVFKRNKLSKSGVVRRLLWYYDQANGIEIDRGEQWYYDANGYASMLSDRFDVPLVRVAAVLACLSPQKNWQENQKLAKDYLSGIKAGHFRSAYMKADMCMMSDTSEEMFNLISKGMKSSHFFMNIAHPDMREHVTIDRHAIGACIYSSSEIQTIPESYGQMTKKQYNFFVSCYKSAAEYRGSIPCQMQAVVWTVYRRLKGLPSEYNVTDNESDNLPF